MADTAVHNFTAKVELADTDEFYLVQSPYGSGDDRKVALSDLRNHFAKNTLAAGTLTASAPMELTQTWNGSGVTFKGRRVSITDTASQALSVLDELVVGGSVKFRVLKTGHIQGQDVGIQGSYVYMNGGYVLFGRQDVSLVENQSAAGIDGFYTISGGVFAWNASSTTPVGGVGDETRMERDASGIIAFKPRNGASVPHSLRIYRAITDTNNYQRQAFQHGADYFEWAAETAGTGTDNIDLRLTPAGTGGVRFGGPFGSFSGSGAPNFTMDANTFAFNQFDAARFRFEATDNVGAVVAANYAFGWTADNNSAAAAPDTLLLRAAAGLVSVGGVLSFGNVAGNTILDSSQTFALKALAGAFYLQSHADGAISGASNFISSSDGGNLVFATANTARWAIDATSGSFVVAGGTPNIGDASGLSPVNVFASARFGFVSGPTINFGSGSPEGVVTATVGSLYLNTAGGTDTTLYTKNSGSGNTGWVAVDNV